MAEPLDKGLGRQGLAGLIFVGLGVAIVVAAQRLPIGTATRMGPGYIPSGLGIILTILGGVALVQAFRHGSVPAGAWVLAPMVFVTAGALGFALLIDRAGLIPSLACLIGLGCYQRVWSHPAEVAVLLTAICAVCAGIFIYALDLPFAMF